MKCSHCRKELDDMAFHISELVGNRATTMVVHRRCLDDLAGAVVRRKLEDSLVRVGWVQLIMELDPN